MNDDKDSSDLSNPYQPPRSDQSSSETPAPESTPDYALYDANGVGIATFLGSVLAGGVIMSMNYRRAGMRKKANESIRNAFLGLLLWLGIIAILPEEIPGAPLNIAIAFGMLYMAKGEQGPLLETHIRNGGKKASNWKAAGIGLLLLIPSMAFVLLILIVLQFMGLITL